MVVKNNLSVQSFKDEFNKILTNQKHLLWNTNNEQVLKQVFKPLKVLIKPQPQIETKGVFEF